jgi:acyl phosphate:glycerol-3-phosphate acyltransferase
MTNASFLYGLVPLVGYLIGSFPTGVVISRHRYGFDVREMGSGNIGATNITRVFGWYAGFLVFLIDFLKGYLPLLLLKHYLTAEPWLLTVTATALVLGHCFSLYLHFRGGKGVATSLGCLLIVSPPAAAFAVLVYVILLSVTKISAVGSLGGIITALIYLCVSHPSGHETALILSITVIVLIRHRSNIQRLVRGMRREVQ